MSFADGLRLACGRFRGDAMRYLLFPLALATAVSASPAAAVTPRAAAAQVSQQRLHAIVEKLVSFGTRHTLSSQTDPNRGIGAAERWTAEEFGRYSQACGGRPTLVTPGERFTGPRS